MSVEQTKQLEQALRPVAGRLRQAELRPKLVRAVFFAAAVALLPAVLRLATGNIGWGAAALALLIGFPLVSLARAFSRRPDMRRAALAVDRHYQWQDLITTAWSALSVGGLTPLEQYVAEDAVKRIPKVSPGKVVPLSFPKGVPAACGLAVVVLCALLWPVRYDKVALKKPPETAAAALKPIATTIPAVTPNIAQSSLRQMELAHSPLLAPRQAPPAPDRRLIHDYFEAVCPPGR